MKGRQCFLHSLTCYVSANTENLGVEKEAPKYFLLEFNLSLCTPAPPNDVSREIIQVNFIQSKWINLGSFGT